MKQNTAFEFMRQGLPDWNNPYCFGRPECDCSHCERNHANGESAAFYIRELVDGQCQAFKPYREILG